MCDTELLREVLLVLVTLKEVQLVGVDVADRHSVGDDEELTASVADKHSVGVWELVGERVAKDEPESSKVGETRVVNVTAVEGLCAKVGEGMTLGEAELSMLGDDTTLVVPEPEKVKGGVVGMGDRLVLTVTLEEGQGGEEGEELKLSVTVKEIEYVPV